MPLVSTPSMHHFHLWEQELGPILNVVADSEGLLKVGVRDKLGLRSSFDVRFANPVVSRNTNKL